MTAREKTIDVMKELLDLGKISPIYKVRYEFRADTNEIESWILEGNRSSDDEFNRKANERLEEFRNSDGYVKDGKSLWYSDWIVDATSINYWVVSSIVNGLNLFLPRGYEYIGNLKMIEGSYENSKQE
jgi:hypothetical protein